MLVVVRKRRCMFGGLQAFSAQGVTSRCSLSPCWVGVRFLAFCCCFLGSLHYFIFSNLPPLARLEVLRGFGLLIEVAGSRWCAADLHEQQLPWVQVILSVIVLRRHSPRNALPDNTTGRKKPRQRISKFIDLPDVPSSTWKRELARRGFNGVSDDPKP